MPISIAEIKQKTFARVRQGYDPQAVDEFINQLAGDYEAMLRKIADLKTRLTSAETKTQELAAQLDAAKTAVNKAQAQAAQAAQEARASAPVSTKSNAYIATEEQLSQALIAAQQTADRIVGEAKTTADRIRSDAENQARKVIRQALDEKQSELDEMERIKKSREQFRDEYIALVQKFMDAATSNFPSSMMGGSVPSGSASTSAVATRQTQLSQGQAATPYGSRVETAGMDDLD